MTILVLWFPFVRFCERRLADSRRIQFSLKALLVLMLVSALLLVIHRERSKSQAMLTLSRVTIEVYTDRMSFEKRLGNAVRCVDFEEVNTADQDFVAFAPDRFRGQGVTLASPGGLYAGRTFGFPKQYPSVSGKNTFAPGPVGKNPGGNTTDVTFNAQNRVGLVAGVGITFVDVDYPGIGASSISIFAWDDRPLAQEQDFRTPNAGQVFRGFVAVDADGNLIPAISRAQIINGTGWPGVDAGDGVVLDDLVFAVPEPSGI